MSNLLEMMEEEATGPPKELIDPEYLLAHFMTDKPERVAIDSESPTFKWHLPEAEPFAWTISWGKDRTFYMHAKEDGHRTRSGGLSKSCAETLYKICCSAPTLIFHNAKYDLHVLKRMFKPFGLPLVTRQVEDTMIMSSVLNEYRSHGLKELCASYGISYDEHEGDYWKHRMGQWMDEQQKVNGRRPSFDMVPPHILIPYAVADAYMTWELWNVLRAEMDQQLAEYPDLKRRADVEDAYRMEMELVWVILAAEERGIRVDLDFVYDRISELTPQLEHIKSKVEAQLGWAMNPGSTEDVAKALEQFGVPSSKLRYNGRAKLPEWVLGDLIQDSPDSVQGQLARDVLEYRGAQKVLSAYFETLANEHWMDEHGQAVIRCNIKQTGARTGRMSVTDPALQTLPREKGNVRGAFIAREGHKLIFSDYTGQELAVLGHFTKSLGDTTMEEVFKLKATDELNGDLHRVTAADVIYKCPIEQIDKKQRANGKTLNFAIVYGAGTKKVGQMLSLSYDEASAVLKNFYNKFPGVKSLKWKSEGSMKKRGWVVTPFGRRHRQVKGKEYKTINSIVQGTSAELTKLAMILIAKEFIRRKMRALVLLAVHDEIICEAPDEEVPDAIQIIHDCMTKAKEVVERITVPLYVEISVASRWSEKGD